MKLPTKIRYAVRAVVELTDKEQGTPIPVKDIAEAQGMSAKYVKQLMNRLQRAGLVKGHPGIHGGYTLAKEPGAISLFDIYQALDVSLVLVPCVGADPECDRMDKCCARKVWKSLYDSLEDTLKNTSVKELAKCERDLRGHR
jgi:Rrf2 family cysteine metabolism transcriptional repressor